MPTKDAGANIKSAESEKKTSSSVSSSVSSAKSATDNGSSNGNKISTKKLIMNEEFKCRARELYQVFVDPNVTFQDSFK